MMGKQKQKYKKEHKGDILDHETVQYYERISHELKQDFDNDENKGKWHDSLLLHHTTPHVIRASSSSFGKVPTRRSSNIAPKRYCTIQFTASN